MCRQSLERLALNVDLVDVGGVSDVEKLHHVLVRVAGEGVAVLGLLGDGRQLEDVLLALLLPAAVQQLGEALLAAGEGLVHGVALQLQLLGDHL